MVSILYKYKKELKTRGCKAHVKRTSYHFNDKAQGSFEVDFQMMRQNREASSLQLIDEVILLANITGCGAVWYNRVLGVKIEVLDLKSQLAETHRIDQEVATWL